MADPENGTAQAQVSAKIDRPRRSSAETASRSWVTQKAKLKAKTQLINSILKKSEDGRTAEEKALLETSQDIVVELARRGRQRENVKRKLEEVEDSADVLDVKTQQLADAIRNARHLVVYTGAGVSTAASIPDYRGPNGVWTLLQKGFDVKTTSLVDAEPTLTHMSLVKLQQKGLVQHVVSQNCDGLHLRSGLPARALSEVHGNMYIEVCNKCKPEGVYTRLFDVTERTAKFRHDTGRKCHKCRRPLRDSIVHFGEKGAVEHPLNWRAAIDAAEDADMILCLGSSLKVLRRYPFLWATNKSKQHRPQLHIVNLQWTPKDSQATIKIHGKCDQVMKLVMYKLGLDVPVYQRSEDPIFSLTIPLKAHELKTFSTKMLRIPSCNNNDSERTTGTATSSKRHSCKQHWAVSALQATDTVKDETDIKEDIKEEETVLVKPGWFGKGCRKRTTKRRRSSRVSIKDASDKKISKMMIVAPV